MNSLRYCEHMQYFLTVVIASKRPVSVRFILPETLKCSDFEPAYEALADFTAASEAYRGAMMWRESLSCASSASLPEHEVSDLAESLLETLLETKDFISAAIISLEYLQDLARAARLYCKAYQFSEATRIIGFRRRPELLDSVVDPGLVESSGAVTELLADCRTQLAAQIPRLRELRLMKLDDPRKTARIGRMGCRLTNQYSCIL